MKHQPNDREGGISIPGLIDKIIARLPEPYILIAEWSRYVALDDLLGLPAIAITVYDDNDDGTLTMRWKRATKSSTDYIVPRDLQRRTVKYLLPLLKDQQRAIRLRIRDNTIFVVDMRPVTPSDFAREVIAAASR